MDTQSPRKSASAMRAAMNDTKCKANGRIEADDGHTKFNTFIKKESPNEVAAYQSPYNSDKKPVCPQVSPTDHNSIQSPLKAPPRNPFYDSDSKVFQVQSPSLSDLTFGARSPPRRSSASSLQSPTFNYDYR